MQINKTVKAVFGVAMAAVLLVGTSASAYTFTSSLKLGSTGTAVKELQKVLNMSADTQVAAAGKVGGPGMETTKFGPATKAALQKFQAKNNLSPLTGATGPGTRAALNAISGGSTTPTTPTTPTQTGPVTAMLATDNPAAGTVLGGQALADLAHFTFNGNGTLSQVTLKRTGLSTSADISNVYLFDGNMRVTDGASVNTNGDIVFSGLNIAVNGSKTLSVKADMAASNTISSVSLGVSLTGFMVSGSSTANTVNIAGNLHYVSAAPNNSSSATLGTQTVSSASINAGSMQYTVWSAPLQVSGRAAWLKGANFRAIGSAPTDAVQNIKLYVDGTAVGSATSVSANGYAFFDFSANPVNLTTGSHTIDVRGDIQKGSNRTVQFSIQNASDLMVTDSQLGTNIVVTSAVSNGAAGTITINAGSVTTTIDPSFQTMTNVTGGATNAVIGKFKLHAYGEDVKVNTLSVTPNVANGVASGSSDLNSLNNVTLFFNGSQVGSSFNWTSGATTVQLGSSLVVPAGSDSILEVRADIVTSDNYNLTSGTVTVSLAAGSSNGQGMSSLSTSINVPASTTATSGLTIQTGSLSVAKNTAYANQSISPNTTGATIGSFVLQNQSSSESVRVTNLAVGLVLTSAGSTNYSNLKTDETSGSGSTPINPSTANAGSTSSNNFSVNFTLAPGATKVINVMSDVSSATGSLAVTLVPTALGASSNVNVTPSSVTGQTITVQTATFGTPTLINSASTTAQYVAAANGSTDGSKAEFNLTSSNGSATVSEAKFVVRGTSTVSGLNTVASVRVGSQTAPIVLATTNSTTLSTSAGSATATISLTSATGVAAGSILLIDSEQILVTTYSSASSVNVTRGYNGTTAATHSNGATVSVMNGVAYFTGLNLSVPNSTAGVNVDVYPTYSSVGTNGVTSGSSSTLSLSYLKYTVGNSTQTSCVASLSCTNNMAEISANAMTVVGSKPTFAIATPSATLSAASTAALDVTVTADAKGDITLVTLPITVGLTGASVSTGSTSNIAVYAGNDLSTNLASSNTAFSAATGSSSTITLTNSGYRISAGQSVVFHVYVTIVGMTSAASGSNSMSTSLSTSGLTWTDTAGGGSAGALTSSLLYGYPTGNAVIRN
ncbi:MAG: peptidoglycan-binding domain-containing protein [bacterium]